MALSAAAKEPETIVQFEGTDAPILGILHTPTHRQLGVCVIMLNSGQQSRVGPGRLYVRAARELADAGVHALRVDLAGVGDSVCENPATHFDGHRPDEVRAAVRYARNHLESHAIVLHGLCAGARVAIKAAEDDPDVDGVLAWSVPIYSASPDMPQSPHEPDDRVSAAVARANAARLLRFILTLRFLRPGWWKRQFPGGRGVGDECRRVARSLYRFVIRSDPMKHENPFLRATEGYLAEHRRILFVYGDLDQLSYQEFRDRFPKLEDTESGVQGCALVPGGTHTFSSYASQARAIDLSRRWIEAQFRRAEQAD